MEEKQKYPITSWQYLKHPFHTMRHTLNVIPIVLGSLYYLVRKVNTENFKEKQRFDRLIENLFSKGYKFIKKDIGKINPQRAAQDCLKMKENLLKMKEDRLEELVQYLSHQ